MSDFHIRQIEPADRDEVARLIYHSTNDYYVSIGRSPIFQADELSPTLFVDVYDRLDGPACQLAVDNVSGQIIGSCFVHQRETHVSLGIMNVHSDHFGRGVARALLRQVIDLAESEGKPVRLVSSCFNLDSYSLYTRAGFSPFCTFQDMILSVPDEGLPASPPNEIVVRDATKDDIGAMAELELEVSGISRRQDYEFFIENEGGRWRALVVDRPDGALDGFLVSCLDPVSNMIGPGVMSTERVGRALLYFQLQENRGRTPVFLLPVRCRELVAQAYAWGARNCEMHVAQSTQPTEPPAGVILPTFLPESG